MGGGIDEEETPNPSMNDLLQIPKIFVSQQAVNALQALSDELGLVGRDGPDDPICMTNTRHAREYYAIFNPAIKKMTALYKKRKYPECMQKLLAIILGIKDF